MSPQHETPETLQTPEPSEAPPPGSSRHSWTGVAILTIANLVPLVLVLQGSLDLPLLLLCYVVESVVLMGVGARQDGSGLFGTLVTVAFGSVLFLALGAAALGHVDWGRSTLLVLVATVTITLLGTFQARRSDPALVTWSVPTMVWRLLVLLVGTLVAIPFLENITDLRAAGWPPWEFSDALIACWGYPLAELLMEAPLAPAVLAAAIWVLFVSVNESLFAVRRVLLSSADQRARR